VTTIRAPLRPRSAGRDRRAGAELALPVLTVMSGLQLLRLLVATLVGVYRDRLGASLASLALFAFGVVALGLLAGPADRLLGRRRLLVLSAAGVALVRLALQLIPDALTRFLLAPVGVVLFLWFVPAWLAWMDRDGGRFGLALVAGLAVDTALVGLAGGWDYAWSITAWTVALSILLAGAALVALAVAMPGPDPRDTATRGPRGTPYPEPGPPGTATPELGPPYTATPGAGGPNREGSPTPESRDPAVHSPWPESRDPAVHSPWPGSGDLAAPSPWRWADLLPLAGIGPALFLQALIWQNLGWQAELGDRSQGRAFLLVMVANLVALGAGTAVALAGEVRWPAVGTALAGLAVAVALAGWATAAACVLGQAALGVLVVLIVRRATGPGREPGRSPGAGVGRLAAAWTGGMAVFLLLVFAYYAVYDVVLPVGNGPVPAMAAALVGLAAVLAMGRPAGRERLGTGLRPATGSLRGALAPIGRGVVLLAAPALAWATAPDPVPAAPAAGADRPVRVMSYNLHFGFDVRGWSDLEGVARAIEAAGPEVVGLQEVSRGWYINGSTDMLGWLQRRLRMPHARFAGASDAIWGNAVLSRHPIVADELVPLPSEDLPLRRNALRVELDLGGGRRLQVVVTHLHHVEGPGGTRVRLAQLPRLLDEVAGRPATVLLGDLNAEPDSAEVALLRAAGLTDAFVAGGGRPGDELTWPSDRPDRRIDYIWFSPDLTASGFAATTVTASDHRGIAATIR
jgi:endonuclease/exonuclease/phosphatase family metal-dependent hydrolase